MNEEQNKTGEQNEKPVKAKGKVTVTATATFELDEEKLQCLHKEGLTVTTVTVN